MVSRFSYLRDPKHPLLQVMFQTRLTSHIPTFLVSSSIGPPARMVGFVKEVVQAFRFVSARFSLDYLASVSRRKLYRDLIDNVFPVPVQWARPGCLDPGEENGNTSSSKVFLFSLAHWYSASETLAWRKRYHSSRWCKLPSL